MNLLGFVGIAFDSAGMRAKSRADSVNANRQRQQRIDHRFRDDKSVAVRLRPAPSDLRGFETFKRSKFVSLGKFTAFGADFAVVMISNDSLRAETSSASFSSDESAATLPARCIIARRERSRCFFLLLSERSCVAGSRTRASRDDLAAVIPHGGFRLA
jgi:hypothetical protein